MNFLNNFEIRVIKIFLGESEIVWKYEMNLIEINREFLVFNLIFVKVFFFKVSEDVLRIKDVDLLNDMG